MFGLFGGLSEAKREAAISRMIDMINAEVQQLIFYTSKDEYNTPKKPYVDELYVLCFMFVHGVYSEWRKRHEDAAVDMAMVLSEICEHAFERYKGDRPFRSRAKTAKSLKKKIGESYTKRAKEYETALHHEMINVAAEQEKLEHDVYGFGSGGGIGQELMASALAEKPFQNLVTQTVFGLDGDDEEAMSKHSVIGTMAADRLSRAADELLYHLKSL